VTPSRYLGKLQGPAMARLGQLAFITRMCMVASRGDGGEREAFISHVAINALNTWSNFARAFYLSCCFGAKSVSGKTIEPGAAILCTHDALTIAIQNWNPKATRSIPNRWKPRDEPAWHDPDFYRCSGTGRHRGQLHVAQRPGSLP
jgi:hypothetical protein